MPLENEWHSGNNILIQRLRVEICVSLKQQLKISYTSENICTKARYCFAAVVFSF